VNVKISSILPEIKLQVLSNPLQTLLGLSKFTTNELRSNSLMKDREIKSPAKAPESNRAKLSLPLGKRLRFLAELSFMITDIETLTKTDKLFVTFPDKEDK
jgi:hypothetical protein